MRSTKSRLERLEERRSARKAAFLTILTLIIIGLAVVYGIPLLIKVAVFVGDLSSANRPVDKTDTISPAPPNLYSPYTATNSASLTVNGISEPGATVYITNNNEPVGNVIVKEDGTFQFSNIQLKDGANEIKAVAADGSDNYSNPSRSVNVFFSIKEPKLEVSSPTEGQKITSNDTSIDVWGNTDVGNRVWVNDRMAVVDNSGKWLFRIGLASGENTIIVIATDKTGNTTKKEIKVTFVPQ